MITLVSIFQIVIALGLVNVWVIRFHKVTKYRARNSKNMRQEFHEYGLPQKFMYFVGFLKISVAICMVLGFWFPVLILPASAVLVILMSGAIYMHNKVRDTFIKFLPAILMFAISLGIILLLR